MAGSVLSRARLAALCALALAACRAPDQRIAPFAEAWERADFVRAEQEIDALVADEAGVDPEIVASSRGLDESIDPRKGDTFLFLLEKSMTRLAADDLDATIDLLRRSRDVLGERYNDADVTGWLAAALTDDTLLEYKGADYEHVLVPSLLALADLLEGGQDAYAYALQVGEVQERILGSTFGENVDGKGNGYNPRKQYQRVAVGAYIEGLVRERESFTDEAFKAYERAREWGPGAAALAEACERTTNGVYSRAGHGVVHVFYLGGRGPRLVQGRSPVTENALFLANVTSIVTGGVGTLGQASIPVPTVAATNLSVPPLEVRAGGTTLGLTSLLLDVNQVAVQQLEANMPWILARAVIRRTSKAVGANVAQRSVERHNDPTAGLLVGILTNLVLTAGEKADTRNWTSLPATIQVARVELPEGVHALTLGPVMKADVRVAAGKDSYVLVLQPDLSSRGVVIVDAWSRPVEAPQAVETKP